MFERFTDRARKIMAVANQEAQRFNHEYVGPEHILLGMCKIGPGSQLGAAGVVLERLDIDLRKVRLECEKMFKGGPDMVTMGKLPQTPRAKKVIELAIATARDWNHDYVGTEHLLLGLIREPDGIAGVVLRGLGLTAESLTAAAMEVNGAKPQAESPSANPTVVLFSRILGALDETYQCRVLQADDSMEKIRLLVGAIEQIYSAMPRRVDAAELIAGTR